MKKMFAVLRKKKKKRAIRQGWLSIHWYKGEKLFLPLKSDEKSFQGRLQAYRESKASRYPFLSVYVTANVISTLGHVFI